MRIIRKFFLAAGLCFYLFGASSVVHAFDAQAISQMAQSVNISKDEIGNMIDLLQQTGQITPAQAEQAKKELSQYSDDDIQALKQQAVQKIDSAGSKDELLPHNMLEENRENEGLSKDSELSADQYQEVLRYLGQ